MLRRLNHVAIAVPDVSRAAATYSDRLGARISAPRPLPEHGVTIVIVELDNCRLELMEPLGETSPIAAFLARNPAGGLHHVCFEVDDIAAAQTALAAEGTRTLGPARTGAHGRPVLFVHPKDLCGVLVELEEATA